jgi:transcriptional regulator with XRE-family HTH domain
MSAVRQFEVQGARGSSRYPVLSRLVREVRRRHGWTLKQLSDRCGIPVSTLAKVEAGRLTLSYERVVQLAERTGLKPREFMAMAPGTAAAVARRSTQRWDEAIGSLKASTTAYQLCTELLGKRMDVELIHLSAGGSKQWHVESGDGEAYYLILSGSVEFQTEFYRAETLSERDSIYLDSTMHHFLTLAPAYDEAFVARIFCGRETLTAIT